MKLINEYEKFTAKAESLCGYVWAELSKGSNEEEG